MEYTTTHHDQEPPRIIVVGAGRWGRQLITVCSRQALLAGVVTRGGEESARWLARDYPAVAVMTDLDAVLADNRLDAVVVATPSTSLAPIARRALEARRDVLVEKPVATDAATVHDLADLAQATGRTLWAGYTYLFDPAFDALLRMTEGDPVIQVTAHWRKNGTFGQSILWNLLCHEVALLLNLFGAAPVAARVLSGDPLGVEAPRLVCQLSFPRGGEAVLDIDRAAQRRDKSLTVTTASGRRLTWDGMGVREHGLRPDPATSASVSTEFATSPLEREIASFLGAVARKRLHSRAAPPDGVFAAHVADALELLL